MGSLDSFAASLGLKVVSERFGAGVIAGRIEGRSFRLQVFPEAPTVVHYDIEPPLDLGLSISGRALGTSGLGVLATHVHMNDSDWDDELWSGADESGRGRLFLHPGLRKAVIRMNIVAVSFGFDDRQVTLVHPMGDNTIGSSIQLLLQIAEQIEIGRASLPAATPLLGHAAALQSIAQRQGYACTTTPLRLSGQADDHEILWECRRIGALSFRFFLTMRSKTMRPFGLRLRRQTLADGVRKVFGAEDIEVGDAAFDRAFMIQAEEPLRAKDALDEMARRGFLDFASRFESVEWQNERLILQATPAQLAPAQCEEVLGTAQEILSQIARASLREARGPYR